MRQVPAALIAVLLVFPLFLAALYAVGVSTWALDRDFYLRLVDDERLYQIPDATSSASWSNDVVPGFPGIPARYAVRASRESLTPAYLHSQARRVVGQVFDFLTARTPGITITLDLVPVKHALLGEPGTRAARDLAEDLPVGGSPADFVVKGNRLPSSRPSSIPVARAASILAAGLPQVVHEIPDTVSLADAPVYGWSGTPWSGPRWSVFGALVVADVILLALAGGAWVAAGFVGGTDRFRRLQWMGWSLLAPAIPVVLTGLAIILGAVSPWIRFGIQSAELTRFGFPSAFSAALIDAARYAATRVGVGFLATGAVAGGAAIGLLTWSWSIHAEHQ